MVWYLVQHKGKFTLPLTENEGHNTQSAGYKRYKNKMNVFFSLNKKKLKEILDDQEHDRHSEAAGGH
jgi:hypothetical protein